MHPHRHHRWLAATGHATNAAPYTTPHSDGAKVPARPTPGRFESDYQRVEISEQLARLAGVKQAFLLPTPGSGVTTRLTHCRSVAAIPAAHANSIAGTRPLMLNQSRRQQGAWRTTAGTPPAGTPARTLCPSTSPAGSRRVPGGFDHAPYGADVTLADLGLSDEVLGAVRNHSCSRPSPSTPEGQAVGAATASPTLPPPPPPLASTRWPSRPPRAPEPAAPHAGCGTTY